MSYIQDTLGTFITLLLIGGALFFVGAVFQEPVAASLEEISVPIVGILGAIVKFLFFTPPWGTLLVLSLLGIASMTFRFRL